jgi:hypothetical protein
MPCWRILKNLDCQKAIVYAAGMRLLAVGRHLDLQTFALAGRPPIVKEVLVSPRKGYVSPSGGGGDVTFLRIDLLRFRIRGLYRPYIKMIGLASHGTGDGRHALDAKEKGGLQNLESALSSAAWLQTVFSFRP